MSMRMFIVYKKIFITAMQLSLGKSALADNADIILNCGFSPWPFW